MVGLKGNRSSPTVADAGDGLNHRDFTLDLTGSRGTLVGSAEGQRPFARRRPGPLRDV